MPAALEAAILALTAATQAMQLAQEVRALILQAQSEGRDITPAELASLKQRRKAALDNLFND